MLNLSRTEARPDVYLTLPDGTVILVRVLRIDRGQVQLGFDAPRSVRINRGELPNTPTDDDT